VPRLAGSGGLVALSPIIWSLTGGKGLTPAWYVAGLSQVALPIVGGTLVPYPTFILPAATDALGAASLTVQIGAPLPPGQGIAVQAWLLDPGGPFGWAASNAIVAAAP
jgi:hypothetical protein